MNMQIISNYNKNINQNFTSKANPIKPCAIKTMFGKVHVYEPKDSEIYQKDFLTRIADIFCWNFATFTRDPFWLQLSFPGNEHLYKEVVMNYRESIVSSLKKCDEHLSLLIARDKNKNLCGACLTRSYDEVPGVSGTTMYIDSVAIEKPFRGVGLGKIFLENTIDADKKHFTDIFLYGEKLADGFYEKLGFKHLTASDPDQKKVMDYLLKDRYDYPHFISLFTKPLNPDKPRWYNIAARILEQEKQNPLSNIENKVN